MSNKEGRRERSRREILDAAWELMVERGAAVSMAEVAEAAGLTRQSVHLHFGTRAGLLTALVRRADERFEIFEQFERAIRERDAAERLDACLRVWFGFVPKIHPVARDLIRLRAEDEGAATAWSDRMSDLIALFRQLMRSLHDEGALEDGWTVPRAADYLWAGCSVQAWELLVVERGWSEAAASRAIRRGMARSLLRR